MCVTREAKAHLQHLERDLGELMPLGAWAAIRDGTAEERRYWSQHPGGTGKGYGAEHDDVIQSEPMLAPFLRCEGLEKGDELRTADGVWVRMDDAERRLLRPEAAQA